MSQMALQMALKAPPAKSRETYFASILADWTAAHDPVELRGLRADLIALGLTSELKARVVNESQIEIQVGRHATWAKGRARDLVNIADVGVGVSQTLPVLVALRAARPGQLVYVEQPEVHLHPKAQVLLGVQTLVAQGALPPELVKLHWFRRDPKTGNTRISTADLDEAGRFGDWPEDFDDVALEAEGRYLSAAEERLLGK